MPIYEYEPSTEDCCAHCMGGFETLEKIGDDRLEKCPVCESPCEYVLAAFRCGGSPKTQLSARNLERQGFTQYVKKGHGYYEKTAGQGPAAIVDESR